MSTDRLSLVSKIKARRLRHLRPPCSFVTWFLLCLAFGSAKSARLDWAVRELYWNASARATDPKTGWCTRTLSTTLRLNKLRAQKIYHPHTATWSLSSMPKPKNNCKQLYSMGTLSFFLLLIGSPRICYLVKKRQATDHFLSNFFVYCLMCTGTPICHIVVCMFLKTPRHWEPKVLTFRNIQVHKHLETRTL